MAGEKQWYCTFMRKHPQLSLREPKSKSIVRAERFNKRVQTFFNLLPKLYQEENFQIDILIWMKLSAEQDGQMKIINAGAKKRVGITTSN